MSTLALLILLFLVPVGVVGVAGLVYLVHRRPVFLGPVSVGVGAIGTLVALVTLVVQAGTSEAASNPAVAPAPVTAPARPGG